MSVVDLILIGLAVTLEPIPVTGFILVLSTERGTYKGAAYILGWFLSLVVVIAGTVLVTGGKPPRPSTAPSNAVLGSKMAIGVVLIIVAFRQRSRVGIPKKPPNWMAKLDRMSVWAAAGLGLLLQPWVLVGAGAAAVAQMHVSSIESYALLVGFCLLCTASILSMELYAVFSPDSAAQKLDGLRRWIDTHRDQAIIVLALVVGLWLVGDSIYLIVS
ncbi:MAG TPA: GAP family protein [Acidimicrobiales bacterium]|nr:GAP family protein [Acidimicrobiales bacterium]